MLFSQLCYKGYCTQELCMYPHSNQVSYVPDAQSQNQCSVVSGLLVGVHYICTPRGRFQHTLSQCQVVSLAVIPRGNFLMLVPRAYCMMMWTQVVFTLVVCQVLLTRVPLDTVSILCYLVTCPKIPHFHRSLFLSFDSIICNSDGGGVVAMDLCFWLRVAQLFKSHSKYHALFAVSGGRSDDKAKNGTQGKECTIELDGVAIFCFPTHEKILACSAACVHFR